MYISFFPIPCSLSISCISAFPFLGWVFRDWLLFPSCSVPNSKDFPPHRSATLASFFHSERSSQVRPFIHHFQPFWLPSVLDCPLPNAFLASDFPLSFLVRVTPVTSLLSFLIYFLCSWIHLCFPALILHVCFPFYRSKAFLCWLTFCKVTLLLACPALSILSDWAHSFQTGSLASNPWVSPWLVLLGWFDLDLSWNAHLSRAL